jgi:hypothetical protein
MGQRRTPKVRQWFEHCGRNGLTIAAKWFNHCGEMV